MILFRSKQRYLGYTLVEVLVVLAVILILLGITFGTFAGIQSARMKSIAKGELALISQSLSRFQAKYGDYPITEGIEKNSITLSKALLGWKIFDGNPPRMVDLKDIPLEGLSSFIELSKISYSGNLPFSHKIMPKNIRFIDPWGNDYVYFYKDTKDWDNFSYILYSKGPDGKHGKIETSGLLNAKFKNEYSNMDNIYLED